MTDSAKQDATPGQAAGEAEATPAPARGSETANGTAEANDTAEAAAAQEAKPELDDVKARFREALDRKRQVHAEGQGKGGHEAGKVSGAHGPAASRRNFRRKSG
jgi:hypothetical protein